MQIIKIITLIIAIALFVFSILKVLINKKITKQNKREILIKNSPSLFYRIILRIIGGI